jgi:catechol 2,3-dioxygenase-like lactoylglutathione lyase family enzyme
MDQLHMAAPVYDRAAEDVGNIVEFGHVNVRVPDQRLATLFYVSGLGLTRDPFLMTSTDNMWINVGTDQFHLPTGAPQVVRGVTGVVIPDLEPLRHRLKRVAAMLGGTSFAWADGEDAVEVTCPWGNRIRVHAPHDRFGPIALGIPYVELATPVGTAERIVRFYREMLHAIAEVATDAGGRHARIGAGGTTALLYRETDAPQPAFDGNHIQIAFADFSGPHRRLLERGLITEESDQHQYRFQAITDLDSGEVLVEMEHEVRSMRHPLFARPLINRNPLQSNRNFAPGREVWPWSAPAE